MRYAPLDPPPPHKDWCCLLSAQCPLKTEGAGCLGAAYTYLGMSLSWRVPLFLSWQRMDLLFPRVKSSPAQFFQHSGGCAVQRGRPLNESRRAGFREREELAGTRVRRRGGVHAWAVDPRGVGGGAVWGGCCAGLHRLWVSGLLSCPHLAAPTPWKPAAARNSLCRVWERECSPQN
jgi:hypothetical protein